MLKTALRLAVFGLAVSLVGSGTPVSAYPVGTNLTATIVPDMIVAKTGKATLTIKNANPSTFVTVQYGTQTSSEPNTATLIRDISGLSAGIYVVNVSTPIYKNKDIFESKSVTLYVPGVTAPLSGKFKAKTVIKLKFLKPGTIITLQPTAGKKKKKRIKVVVKANSTSTKIMIPAKTFIKGKKNTYKLTIGKISKTYKFKGK